MKNLMSDYNKLTRKILELQFGFNVTGHYENGVYYNVYGDVSTIIG